MKIGAVGEMNAGHGARDAGAHLDRPARLEPADEIVPLCHLTHQRRGHRHHRRRGTVPSGEAESGDEQSENGQRDKRPAPPGPACADGGAAESMVEIMFIRKASLATAA